MDNDNQLDLLQAMLKQITIDDPAILGLIAQEASDRARGAKKKGFPNEVIRRLRIQNKKLIDKVILLKDKLKDNTSDKNQVKSQLNDLLKLNNSLADALGSCNTCWGEDSKCVHCSGKGIPGWRKVNIRLFNLYVLPALEKLNGIN